MKRWAEELTLDNMPSGIFPSLKLSAGHTQYMYHQNLDIWGICYSSGTASFQLKHARSSGAGGQNVNKGPKLSFPVIVLILMARLFL